jgi:hypothetical protein
VVFDTAKAATNRSNVKASYGPGGSVLRITQGVFLRVSVAFMRHKAMLNGWLMTCIFSTESRLNPICLRVGRFAQAKMLNF